MAIERRDAGRGRRIGDRLFQAMFMAMDEGAVSWNSSGDIVAVNPAAENILGLSAAALIGRSSADFARTLNFVREDETPFPRELDPATLALQTGKPQHNVLMGAHQPDGTLVWISCNAQPMPSDGESGPYGVVSTFRDVTERKRAEDALSFVARRGWMASKEKFFDALVKYLGKTLDVDHVLVSTLAEDSDVAETVALYAKGAVVANLRYSLKGTPCEQVMGQRFCFYRRGIQLMFPENALLAAMGAESYSGLPLWDSAGQPIGLIAILDSKPLRDEALVYQVMQFMAPRAAAELERERNDRILRQSEREFRILADNMPDNVVRHDRQARVRYVNPALLASIPAEFSVVVGESLVETFPGNAAKADLHRLIMRVIETGAPADVEFQLPNPCGEMRVHEVRYVAERDSNGEIVGVLGIGRDITERKLAEEYEQFRSHTLELLSGGAPLPDILECIVRGVEQLKPDMICSILLLDSQGKRFRKGIGPTRPDSYNAGLDGLEIGIGVGSCGTAAATGERVIVEDIQTHPYWAPYKEIAAGVGLAACWSEPIRASTGQVLGTFAAYHRQAHSPAAFDIALIEKSTHLVSIAIERRRAEEALRASELEFRSLAENMPDNVIRYDRQARAQYMNPALLASVAPDFLPVLGKSPIETYPGDDVAANLQRMIESVIATGISAEFEFDFPNPQGEMRTHQLRYVAERDEHGEIVGALGIGCDITEHKRAEEYEHFRSQTLELLSRGASLPDILESIVRGVEQLDRERICSILLLDSDGRHFCKGIAPSLPESYNAALDGLEIGVGVGCCGTAAATGKRVIADDLTTHPYWAPYKQLVATAGLGACWSEPIRASTGEVLGTFAVYHRHAHSPAPFDIALIEKSTHLVSIAIERRRAEEALRASEREFRTLAENLPDPLVRYDRMGRRTYVSPVLERAFAVTAESMVGVKARETNPTAMPMRETYVRALEHTLATGKRSEFEMQMAPPGENMRTYMCFMVAERALDGQISGAIAVSRDITERKRAELEREAHAHSLECLDRINKAIQRTTDLEQMMSDVLDVVLAIFDCDRAFLVYPCDPAAAEFRVPMECTKPEYPGALALGRDVPMDKEASKMMRITLGSIGPVKFGPGTEYPLPRYLPERYGVKSQMQMALHPKQDQPWEFGIHQCSHAKVWTEDEAALFQKIGQRLTDALTGLLIYRNLQASEQKFRTLAENLPDVLVRYDREGRRTYANRTLEREFAVTTEPMIGKTLRETNPTGTTMMETYQRALEHTLATGERSEFEMQAVMPDGSMRTGLCFMVAERAEDGRISGAIAVSRDITEQKRTEARLALQARRAEVLLELPDASEAMDEVAFMQRGQELSEELTGSSISFIHFVNEGEDSIDLVTWSRRTLEHYCRASFNKHYPTSQAGIWADALRQRRPVVFNDYAACPHRRGLPEGHAELTRLISLPVIENGKVVMLAGVGNKPADYTDLDVETVQLIANEIWRIVQRKRTDKQLKEHRCHLERLVESRTQALSAAKEAAEVANRGKSHFLAAASHDLRQPLQAIRLFNDALAMSGLNERQKKIGNALSKSVSSLNELLNDLLDLSRLDAGTIEPQPVAIQAEDLLEAIRLDFDAVCQEKNLRLKLACPHRDLVLLSDENLLLTLLRNLVSNAVKYTKRGGILVGIRRRGDCALIQVWDTGIGIPAELRDSIFEEYFQIDNPERDRTKGVGLGLAIVRRLSKLLGVGVCLYSREGKGSVFEVSVPLADEPDRPVLPSQVSAMQATDMPSRLAGKRIVVIDDDGTAGEAIKLALEMEGAQVILFDTPEDALGSAEVMGADYYISDYRLPGMNGLQLLDAIQKNSLEPIKAVLLTGNVSPDQISSMRSCRWKVVLKPIALAELLAALDTYQAVHLA